MSKISDLENHPNFAKLSFEEQLRLRALALNHDLGKAPQFISLPTEQKTQIFDTLLYRPPKFEENGSVNEGHWKRIMGELQAGNENVVNEGLLNLAIQSLPDNSVLIGLGNLVLGKMTEVFGGEKFDQANRDRKKFLKYIDYKLSKDSRYSTSASLVKLASAGIGLMADMIPMYGTMVGTLARPAGLAKAMMTGVSKSVSMLPKTSLGLWTLGKALPATLHSVAGGAVGILRETTRDFLDGSLQDQSFVKTMINSAKYFGEYALGDLAMFAIGGALKGMFGGVKHVVTGTRPINNDDYFKLLTQALGNEKVDPVLFSKLMVDNPAAANWIKTSQAFSRVANNIENATKADLVKALGGMKGFSVSDDLVVKFGEKSFKAGDIDSAAKWIMGNLEIKPDKKTFGILSTSAKEIQISQKMKKLIKNGDEKLVSSLANVITPKVGKYDPDNVRTFVKGVLRGTGVSDDVVKGVRVDVVDDVLKVKLGTQDLVEIPHYVTSKAEELKVLNNLTDSLSDHLGKEADNLKLENFMDIYREVGKKEPLYSPSWVDDTLKDMQGNLVKTTDGFDLKLPNEELRHFSDYQGVAEYLVMNAHDEKSFSGFLRYYHNADLVKRKDGTMYITQGRSHFGTKENITQFQTLLVRYPQFRPKIPSHLGPKFSIVQEGV